MRGFAFKSIIPLYIKIKKLVKSCSDKKLDPQYGEILQDLYNQVESFLEISKRNLCTVSDAEIHPEIIKLRGVIDQIEQGVDFSRSDIVGVLKVRIQSTTPRLEMLEEQYVDALYNSFPDDEKKEEEDAVSSEVVGASDVYQKLKDGLMSDVIVTSLVGMPGIGKTALANKVFHDPMIVERFERRVWVRVGKGCRFRDIPGRILAEMEPGEVHHVDAADDKLKEKLESERCLVVLDDVWDRYTAFHFQPARWNQDYHFLRLNSKSRILVVSRLQQLYGERHVQMRLLDKDESWELLCRKVFTQGLCPPKLERAGKKIAEKCEGLPLTVVTVAALLSQVEKDLEYWNEVAIKKNHRVFKDAYDQISEVLRPSYTYLPRILQTCFLFMGLFCQNYKIPRSNLINLWRADGFDEIYLDTHLDRHANKYLEELIQNNLVMLYQRSTFNLDHSVKTCGLHSSLWHLSNKKARESKFSVILNILDDCLEDAVEEQQRLSFHNNVLFGIKDVLESVETNCATTARSLLCYGPYHQYQVPLCYGLELLRELDAASIRFYEFPMEVLQLVQLRYLALSLNGMIPPSISQLSELQFLIVKRYLNIKTGDGPSYLPVEIWDLKKLKHLEAEGSDLPDPCGNPLENLSTLVNVSAASFTEAVVNAIYNLKELRIQIELAPGDDGKLLNCFTHISFLYELRSLKFVVLNPGVARPVVPFTCHLFMSKLSLSGLGYSWKDMSMIASLPHLNVLKLKKYAFQGPVWEVEESRFPSLVSLVIEDTDLVDWLIGNEAFCSLRQLRMKYCYGLMKICGDFGRNIQKIEVVDCNPLCVPEMKKAAQEKAKECVVDVQFSWDER